MIQEKVTVGAGGPYPLNGIITLPDGVNKCPAVVFVHGSGASNMDEKVMGLTPFRDLAKGLAEQGIGSVRYDKRSYAHGVKMIQFKNITVREETIEDALLAAQLLRQHPRVDQERVFLVGHSMGAMLAPRIDSEGGNFRGLALLAGTPRKMEQVLLEQNRKAMASLPKLLRPLLKKQIAKLEDSFRDLYTLTDAQAQQKKMGGGTTLYYFKEMGEHPAENYLRGLTKPLFIAQGGMDFQVDPEKDFGAYKAILQDAPNVTWKLYPKLNHAFVPGIHTDLTKAKQEYRKYRPVAPQVIADLAQWIRENS